MTLALAEVVKNIKNVTEKMNNNKAPWIGAFFIVL